MGKRLTQEEFIEKARLKHGDKYDYSEVAYVNKKTKVRIICPEHSSFLQTPEKHLMGRGCPQCGGTCKLNTEEFIEKAREIHGDKYDYSEVEYKNSKTKVCIICPEHTSFLQKPNDHLDGHGCSKCGGTGKLCTKEFIEISKKVHKDKYNYSEVVYVDNRTKVHIICPIHGPFYQISKSHLKGHGCPQCNQSKLEKEVKIILENNNINFKYNEFNFDWLRIKRGLQLDFYLPNYNIAIECQGIQHFEAFDFFGGEEKLFRCQERDRIKKILCEEHGVKLYYVNYDDNIEERMNEILNEQSCKS